VSEAREPPPIVAAHPPRRRWRRAAVGSGEVSGEPGKVGRRGAAPAIDGLDGVADGGQRQLIVDAAAEQRRQQDPLGVSGVLIFVEQHHPVAGAQLLTDVRHRGCQPRGVGHLGAEVHHILGPHSPVQCVDQRHQLGAFGLSGQHPQQPLAGPAVTLVAARRQAVHQPFELDMRVAELTGVDQVLGELTRQPQHHRRHRGRGFVGVQLPAVSVDDVECQLPQLCFAEQAGVRFDELRALACVR
jgi:hypothetical protein